MKDNMQVLPVKPSRSEPADDDAISNNPQDLNEGLLRTLVQIGRCPMLSLLEVSLNRSDDNPRRSTQMRVSMFRKKHIKTFRLITIIDFICWVFIISVIISVTLRGLNIHPMVATIDSIDYFHERINEDNYPIYISEKNSK